MRHLTPAFAETASVGRPAPLRGGKGEAMDYGLWTK